MPSIYLINPKAAFPTYFDGDIFAARGFAPAAYFADLVIPTLAAFVPSGWEIALCDENISSVDFERKAEFIGITGKVSQFPRMAEIAAEFRRRGKTVLIGGPYASLVPENVRPHCDILVRGEIEEIASQMFADLASGNWQSDYAGGKPDLAGSPIPRWELYPNDRAVIGVVQTSRGCPFRCEYCDVIEYAGRKQRHKAPAQVIRELDVLYALGYRAVFLADDNFTIYRRRAKELLIALRDWNLAQEYGKVSFATQLSIDAAEDEELLALCAEAGLVIAYIGIETSNKEALRQAKKPQNLRRNLTQSVRAFHANGIRVMGGMVVGFDADGPEIFEALYDFAMTSGVAMFSLGALVAPDATPLFDRLQKAGRLKQGAPIALVPWATNVIHPTMSEARLERGRRWLANRIYAPAAFAARVEMFLEQFGPPRHPRTAIAERKERPIDTQIRTLVGTISRLGPEEAAMMRRISAVARARRDATGVLVDMLLQYLQIRHVYESSEFWDPNLAKLESPWVDWIEISPKSAAYSR